MEENVQVMARKLWHIVRVAYFMLRKNISKRKLLLELKYLAMKRPKLNGKSLAGKLTLHNYHNHPHLGGAYEFSCSNTPSHPNNHFPFQFKHNKKAHKHQVYAYASTKEEEESELNSVDRVLEMMFVGNGRNEESDDSSPFPYSPALPGLGFGRSPVVRQLRVTDSPYQLQNYEEGDQVGNYHVDEAAEEFIKRFYDQLNQQRITGA